MPGIMLSFDMIWDMMVNETLFLHSQNLFFSQRDKLIQNNMLSALIEWVRIWQSFMRRKNSPDLGDSREGFMEKKILSKLRPKTG